MKEYKDSDGGKLKIISPREFRNLGLVQEINRRILHPMGLALAVTYDDEDESRDTIGPVFDFRDENDEGPWFDWSSLEGAEVGEKKAINVDKLMDSKKEVRIKKFGYVIQPIPSQTKQDQLERSLDVPSTPNSTEKPGP